MSDDGGGGIGDDSFDADNIHSPDHDYNDGDDLGGGGDDFRADELDVDAVFEYVGDDFPADSADDFEDGSHGVDSSDLDISRDTALAWQTSGDLTDDHVRLPPVMDDPFWEVDGHDDVTSVFGGASVADLLGVFDGSLFHGSSGAAEDFHEAVRVESWELEGLDTVDGYVTPDTLGQSE